MAHPLIGKFRECKSLEDMIKVVRQNRGEVDRDFFNIILEDIRNYSNLGNFNFAFDLVEVAFLSASILRGENYIVSAKMAKAELLYLIDNPKESLQMAIDIRKSHALSQQQEARLFLIEGNAYSEIRDYERALSSYGNSKTKYDEISDGIHSGVVKLHIAKIYLDCNKLDEAEELFVECEEFFQSKGASGIMALAMAIEGRGKVEANRYNFEKSFELLERAFQLYLNARSPLRAYYVKLYLITIYPELNAFEEAHSVCTSAREQLSQLGLLMDVARVDWYEGIIYRKEKKYAKALSLVRKAKKVFLEFDNEPDAAHVQVEEAAILDLMGNSEEALSLYSKPREVFIKNDAKIDVAITDLNEANLRRKLDQDDKATQLLIKSLKFAEENKLPLLIYGCRALLGNIFEKKNQLNEAADHYEEAVKTVERMRFDLKREMFKIGFVMDKQQLYEQLVLTYLKLGQPDSAIEFVERSKLQSMLDIMFEKRKGERIKFKGRDAIQELLDDETVIVEYFVTPKISVAFVISRTQFQVIFIDITEKDLCEMVGSLLDELERSNEDQAYEIFRLLIKPLKKWIANASRVCFIPHKFLYSLPFCALRDDKYLIENHRIFFSPSLALFDSVLRKRAKSKDSILALANPENDLPRADIEGKEISKFFKKRILLSGKEATKSAFFKFAGNFNIAHFACHGGFEEKRPQESALLLADGPLKALEISNLNLDLELVVLSACMSGRVRVEAGDEIMGLLRGFIYSGARCIVSSLWEVAENSSLDFMRVFYEKMQSMQTSEAFQCAQLELKKRYPEPIVWSSYFLFGDYR